MKDGKVVGVLGLFGLGAAFLLLLKSNTPTTTATEAAANTHAPTIPGASDLSAGGAASGPCPFDANISDEQALEVRLVLQQPCLDRDEYENLAMSLTMAGYVATATCVGQRMLACYPNG